MSSIFRPLRLDAPAGGSIVHRGALGTVGVLAQSVSRVLTNMIIGRLGGPAVLGVVASAISTAQLLSLLWAPSAGSAASKFVARSRGTGDYEEASAVAGHLARRTLHATWILAIGAVPLWIAVDRGNSLDAVFVAVLVVGYSGYGLTRGLHFGAAQVGRVARWDLLSSGLGVSGVAICLLFGVRGLGLLMPIAGAALLFTIAGWPWGARPRIQSGLRREIDVFVLISSAGTLASAGFLQLSTIAARVIGEAEGAGQYSAAMTLATPPAIIAGSLSLVLYPTMSEAHGRGDLDSLRRQTDQATRLLVVTMFVVIAPVGICSRFLVAFVWGDEYTQAGLLLPILLMGVFASIIVVPSSNVLTSGSGQVVATATYASIAGLVVGAIVWFAVGPLLGIVGIAVGYLAGATTTSVVAIVVAWRRARQRWGPLFLRMGLAVAVYGLVVFSQHRFDLQPWSDPILAAGFVALWVCVSWRDSRLVGSAILSRLRKD